MSKTVMVIGATGMLGKPVAHHLKAKGFKVRVLVRDIHRARQSLGNSFEMIEGSIDDSAVLEKSLAGCFGVHINLSDEIELSGSDRVVAAAVKNKLKRISYISGTSVCEEHTWFPLIKTKFHVENTIYQSGIPYTIFRPTWFMEVVPNFVKETKAYVFGKQPNPYHLIAAEDYARMVAAAYLTEKAVGKIFYIHGPEGVLLRDAVSQYCKTMRPDLKKVTTLPYWLISIIAALKGNDAMKWAGKFAAYFEKVGERGDPAEANNLLGAPVITFDEWLQRRRKPE